MVEENQSQSLSFDNIRFRNSCLDDGKRKLSQYLFKFEKSAFQILIHVEADVAMKKTFDLTLKNDGLICIT